MTHSQRFNACLAEVLRWEGGWSDDPYDPGGATMRGITIGVYAAWVGAGDVERLDDWALDQLRDELRTIDDATVAEIYHRNYWQLVRGDELPPGVDLAVFDFGVNSGPARAIRHLQKCLGVGIDGHIGPRTLAAARAADPAKLIPALMDSRWAFMRQIKHFWRFQRGWGRRVAGIRVAALRMAGAAMAMASVWSTTVHPPLPDPDAQSATQAKAYEDDKPSMAASTTGRASEIGGGLGSAQIGVEVASAAARARIPGGGVDALGFLLALAQSPTFWIAAGVVASAAYVWLERWRRARVL